MRTEVDDLLAAGRAREVVLWDVPSELLESPGIRGRDASAALIAELPVAEAAHLNGSLPPESMRSLVTAAERHLLQAPLEGVGIELGAGMGILSSAVAERSGVTAVISVDVCENFARLVIPRVADEMLGGSRSERVVAVRGSFDDLSLPDGAVDFVVEVGAFHHADDLAGVVREAGRVLRPGGVLLCFDRAHPDALTDGEVDRMLDRTYTAEWLAENGYPVDQVLTRRQNGEHEYRYFEWQGAFEAAGLKLERRLVFADDLSARNALKGLSGYLPLAAQRALVRRPVPTEYARAFLHRTATPGEHVGDLVVSDAGMHGFLLRKPG